MEEKGIYWYIHNSVGTVRWTVGTVSCHLVQFVAPEQAKILTSTRLHVEYETLSCI